MAQTTVFDELHQGMDLAVWKDCCSLSGQHFWIGLVMAALSVNDWRYSWEVTCAWTMDLWEDVVCKAGDGRLFHLP